MRYGIWTLTVVGFILVGLGLRDLSSNEPHPFLAFYACVDSGSSQAECALAASDSPTVRRQMLNVHYRTKKQ